MKRDSRSGSVFSQIFDFGSERMQNPAGVDSGSVATCGIHQFETNLSAIEMKPTKMQKDLILKNVSYFLATFPESKYLGKV